MDKSAELVGIETRTTFYVGEDGKRRAVVFEEDYANLIKMAYDALGDIPSTTENKNSPEGQ